MDSLIILNKWQEFLKKIDQTQYNVPNAFSFTGSGRVLVSYSLSKSSTKVFGDIDEALSYIDIQINNFIF